jgi:ribosome-associated translation inhibitor RaiA
MPTRSEQTNVVDPEVVVRGDVSDRHVAMAVDKLRAACATPPRPILFARLLLEMEPDPALERPAVAKAGVDLSGQIVRAHVACPTMDEAIDQLVDRIRDGVRLIHERRRDLARRTGVQPPGEWRHGDLPAHRPPYYPRPVGERRLVRTKSVSIGRVSPEEAAFEMRLLDHDFHLYTDAGTGSDCLIHRTGENGYALVSPDPEVGRGPAGEPAELPISSAPRMALADALSTLDATEQPFVAFVDAERGRLHVAYLRYDGHHGLVVPSDTA